MQDRPQAWKDELQHQLELYCVDVAMKVKMQQLELQAIQEDLKSLWWKEVLVLKLRVIESYNRFKWPCCSYSWFYVCVNRFLNTLSTSPLNAVKNIFNSSTVSWKRSWGLFPGIWLNCYCFEVAKWGLLINVSVNWPEKCKRFVDFRKVICYCTRCISIAVYWGLYQ